MAGPQVVPASPAVAAPSSVSPPAPARRCDHPRRPDCAVGRPRRPRRCRADRPHRDRTAVGDQRCHRVLGSEVATRPPHRRRRVAGTVRDPGRRGQRCRGHDHCRTDHVRAGRRRDERCRPTDRVAPRALSLRGTCRHRRRRAGMAHRGRRRFRRTAGYRRCRAAIVRALPTDAELATAGPGRSAAYDRAWSFATYVARHLRHRRAAGALRRQACGPGHPDFATAVRTRSA